MKKEDLTGQTFGRLTVLGLAEKKRGNRVYWRCRCTCGGEIAVEGSHLKNGHTKSCGCYRRELPARKAMDLTGRRFGRLVVLGPEEGKRGYWRCRCDCGNEVVCYKEYLYGGSTRSCGCLVAETRKENVKKAMHFVDGTCVERISSKRTSANNTSGCRGVYRRNDSGWRACIGFQGKLHNLGSFQNYEDAVKARKEAEEQIYGSFLKNYYRERGEPHQTDG